MSYGKTSLGLLLLPPVPGDSQKKDHEGETKSKDMHLYGIKFLDIDEDARAQIEESVRKRHNAFL